LCAPQNELDEASLARLAAKQATSGAPDAAAEDGPAAIPGGTDVASAIAANVWEVLAKVRVDALAEAVHAVENVL
jgi:biotin carboxyl carrier protein